MPEKEPIDSYIVMGNPIAHSKSPRIHTLFSQLTGQQIRYTSRLVEIGCFQQALDKFKQEGGKGANVTVPFKEDAWRCVNQRSARAELAGAVNTIVVQDTGAYFGDNTDGVGLLRDLTVNLGLRLVGSRVLVLGAGGAVRGVLGPLLSEAPREVCIANRTVSKAIDLANAFDKVGVVRGCGFGDLANEKFDVVINGTAASLQGQLPPLAGDLIATGGCCYDMMYGAVPTPFMRWAEQHGAMLIADGLGMLVEQAAESFFIWRGVRPRTESVIDALRGELQSRD